MTDISQEYSKKKFLVLWFLCLVGSLCILPYLYHAGLIPPAVSIPHAIFVSTIQAAIFFGLACYMGYKILPKTDLHPFVVTNVTRQILVPGVVSGVLVGLILYALGNTLFKDSLLTGVHPPFWTGVLASIYGAINEEVLLRLFLFTLLYFIFRKLCKPTPDNRLPFLWITNVLVSIVFGLGHLPAALQLIKPSAFEIFRILLLNGIPGLVFGWLYWSRGLWTAMLAHFVTDLMIHVFLI